MRLDEYVWSRNPRGLHVYNAFQTPMDHSRYSTPRMGWAKLLAAGTEYVDDSQILMGMGITPVVRLYLGRFGAAPFNRDLRAIMDAFVAVGRTFEYAKQLEEAG